MSTNAVSAALWTMRKVEDRPELKSVIEEKGISAIRSIANLATSETDKFWAEKAREMSVRTLETYAKEFRKSDFQACHACVHPSIAPLGIEDLKQLFSTIIS